MPDILTIGHFVIDWIVSPRIKTSKETLGGPPAFVSLAASKLGVKTGIVSKVGEDFRRHIRRLHKNSIDLSHLHIVKNASTTSFVLNYSDSERTLQLKKRAPQILPKDIPDSLFAKAIHVAPVAHEMSTNLVKEFRKKAPILSIDPQGFLRRFDRAGNAKLAKPGDTGFLQNCDIFKSSIEEFKIIAGCERLKDSIEEAQKWDIETILITMGDKGTLALFNNELYHVPACRPRIFKDPTGAGDAFIGGFLAEYIQGKEPLWCCCVGSAAASFVVERVGSQCFGEKCETYARATEIYEKGIKPLQKDFVV